MPELLLILDFFIPAFFFFLGRRIGGKRGKRMIRESCGMLLLSLVFSPLVYHLFSLPVQGIVTSGILLSQCFLVFLGELKKAE